MKIVDFNKYKKYKKRVDDKMFEQLISELKNTSNNVIEYSLERVTEIAKRILNDTSYYNKTSTPILKIAKDFGIITYTTDSLDKDISGVIYVGGTTHKLYNSNKVIFVDENEILKHQRFIVAHELAHYLFDYLGDSSYLDEKKLFVQTYPRRNHSSTKEFLADRFAAEILMPSKLFIEQYNRIMDEKNNRTFTIMYLSEYFKTKISSIEKRINEVLE